MTVPALLAGAAGVLCAAFAALYFFARRIDNYGIVDIAWSYALGAVAVAYAALGPGAPVHRLLVGVLAGVWSARLGTHLLVRIAAHHPVEDSRYRRLRVDWAGRFHTTMLGFFQLQAVSVVLLAVPFLLVCRNPAPQFRPVEYAGAVLWLLALGGEALADAQLAAFRRRATGGVCREGLWRLSRHPNYFFEWLVWVAFALLALGAPQGWLGLLSPACILGLLLRVTGIPMTEEQAIRSKGDAYRAYQRATSAFVPWFPRKP